MCSADDHSAHCSLLLRSSSFTSLWVKGAWPGPWGRLSSTLPQVLPKVTASEVLPDPKGTGRRARCMQQHASDSSETAAWFPKGLRWFNLFLGYIDTTLLSAVSLNLAHNYTTTMFFRINPPSISKLHLLSKWNVCEMTWWNDDVNSLCCWIDLFFKKWKSL